MSGDGGEEGEGEGLYGETEEAPSISSSRSAGGEGGVGGSSSSNTGRPVVRKIQRPAIRKV